MTISLILSTGIIEDFKNIPDRRKKYKFPLTKTKNVVLYLCKIYIKR